MSSYPRRPTDPKLLDDADPSFSLQARRLFKSLGLATFDDLKHSGVRQRLLAHRLGGKKVVAWIERTFEQNGCTLGTDEHRAQPPALPPAPEIRKRRTIEIKTENREGYVVGDALMEIQVRSKHDLVECLATMSQIIAGMTDDYDGSASVLILRRRGPAT